MTYSFAILFFLSDSVSGRFLASCAARVASNAWYSALFSYFHVSSAPRSVRETYNIQSNPHEFSKACVLAGNKNKTKDKTRKENRILLLFINIFFILVAKWILKDILIL